MIYADRVKFVTASTGTGAVQEGSAVAPFRQLAAVVGAGGRQFVYLIQNADVSEYEWGIGAYTAGTPGSLSRDAVFGSSNADAAVNFSAGTKTVSVIDAAAFHGVLDGEMHGATTSGTATALTANCYPQPFALRDFARVAVRLHADIGAAATFNLNGLGALPIMEQAASGLQAVTANRFKSGMILVLRLVNSQWQIANGMVQDVVPSASESAEGVVERATMIEGLAGADTTRFVTPAILAAMVGKKGSNLADGGTVTIPATGGSYFVLDGSTSLGAVALEGGNAARQPGWRLQLGFAAAKTVVHSASLNLVGDVNLAAVARDILELVYEGSGVWREVDFHAAELPEPPPPEGWEDLGETTLTAATEFAMSGLDGDIRHLWVIFDLVPSTNATFRLQTYGADGVLDTGGSDYAWELWQRVTVTIDAVATDLVGQSGGSAASIPLSLEMDSADTNGEGAAGQFKIFNLPASLVSNVEGAGAGVIPGGAFRRFSVAGSRRAKEALRGFRIFGSSGTLTGRVRVLALRDS